jgi:hypothetical protein
MSAILIAVLCLSAALFCLGVWVLFKRPLERANLDFKGYKLDAPIGVVLLLASIGAPIALLKFYSDNLAPIIRESRRLAM